MYLAHLGLNRPVSAVSCSLQHLKYQTTEETQSHREHTKMMQWTFIYMKQIIMLSGNHLTIKSTRNTLSKNIGPMNRKVTMATMEDVNYLMHVNDIKSQYQLWWGSIWFDFISWKWLVVPPWQQKHANLHLHLYWWGPEPRLCKWAFLNGQCPHCSVWRWVLIGGCASCRRWRSAVAPAEKASRDRASRCSSDEWRAAPRWSAVEHN